MGLPTNETRWIILGDTAYRWVVSAHQSYIRRIVVKRENPEQRLAAYIHHDSFVRDLAFVRATIAETYYLIGEAMGNAMKKLCEK